MSPSGRLRTALPTTLVLWALPALFFLRWMSTAYNRDSSSDVLASRGGGGGGILDGTRILYAVASFEKSRIPHPVLDALRDACESGASVDLIVYATRPWTVATTADVRARTSSCRHPRGNVNATVVLASKDVGRRLVERHRRMFYDNLDRYDLFVYAEDDHLIRATSMASWLDETDRVRRLVGPERFADYAVGFVQYEVDDAVVASDRERIIFSHGWPDDLSCLLIDHPGLNGDDGGTGRRYFTTPKQGQHHQGMFMATPEQLRRWRSRSPDCHFDSIRYSQDFMHQESVSSVHLFRDRGCNVTQLLPIDSFDDFLVHHLPNKYWDMPKYRTRSVTVELLRARLEEAHRKILGGDLINEGETCGTKKGQVTSNKNVKVKLVVPTKDGHG